jgi:large subunit ribosomal protein L32e
MKKREEPALKLRERIKSKRPHFRRQEAWRYKRLSGKKEKWRKAEGIDSKMRLKKKGWPKSPEVGYRGPKKARNLHPSGYEEVLVFNVDDLDNVDPKSQVARIAHTVGAKKRVEISTRAGEKGVRILNPRIVKEEAEEKMAEEVEEERKEAEIKEVEKEPPEREKGEKET